MKHLKTAVRYSIFAALLPLIFLAVVSTFAVVMMDWYVEKIQWVIEKVGEACA